MKIPGYTLNIEKAVETINEKDYKKVCLQIPEGLRVYAFEIVKFLEKETSASIIISADPCFGACDVANYELQNLDVELIIQIGHTQIEDIENYWIPTLFINAESDLNISKVIEKAIPLIKGKKIGIISTSQHIHTFETVKEILIKNNFQPVIGKGDNRIALTGQILGCNFSAATSIVDNVDSFLFIGSGNFHPLGLMLTTRKPVIAVDPYTNQTRIKELEELKDIVLRQRYGAIARSKDAKRFGILVGIKRGQQRIELAYKIKSILESKQKESFIITLSNFLPSYLQGFKNVDCYISTACPRIAIDDYMQYKTPILTPVELEILLGQKKWDDYQFDQIIK